MREQRRQAWEQVQVQARVQVRVRARVRAQAQEEQAQYGRLLHVRELWKQHQWEEAEQRRPGRTTLRFPGSEEDSTAQGAETDCNSTVSSDIANQTQEDTRRDSRAVAGNQERAAFLARRGAL